MNKVRNEKVKAKSGVYSILHKMFYICLAPGFGKHSRNECRVKDFLKQNVFFQFKIRKSIKHNQRGPKTRVR